MQKNGKYFKCIICQKKFYRAQWYFSKFPCKFCSLQCKGKFQSINKITPPSRRGIQWSETHKQKIRKIAKEKGFGLWMKGRKLSEKHRENIGEAKKGKYTKENASNWKGGITPLLRQIRTCFKYRQWRSDVFTGNDFTCQDCGVRGGDLEAHHIKEFSKIIKENKIRTLEDALVCEELWNINNGRTLCKKCHRSLIQ